MSLKEKLQALKEQELQAERERVAREKAVRLESEKREQEREAEVERLEVLVREKFSPIFEEVNDAYLKGEGIISAESSKYYSTPQATLSLDWGGEKGVSKELRTYGERLQVVLQTGLKIRLKGEGGRSPELEFNLNDEDWREKAESGIYQILSTPRACQWHTPASIDMSR